MVLSWRGMSGKRYSDYFSWLNSFDRQHPEQHETLDEDVGVSIHPVKYLICLNSCIRPIDNTGLSLLMGNGMNID